MSEHADSIAALAVGALPPDEARLASLAMEQRPDLGAEAEGYRETVRRMMDAFPEVEPGPDVWPAIERSIAGPPRKLRPRWLASSWVMASAAAVALVIATALVLSAPDLSPAAAAEALVAAPGSQTMLLADPQTQAALASVVVGEDGTAYFVGNGLAALGRDRTYQLWSVVDGEVVSAGLLGPSPGAVALRIEGDPEVLAVTAERSGGVVVSEQEPVAVWTTQG